MITNKDINWIYDHIQDCYNQADGLEKSILKDILGLFDSAPEFQIVLTANNVSDEEMRQLLEGARHEFVILPGGQEASVELLNSAPEWIPVAERLPENNSNVMAYLRIGDEGRIYPAFYANGIWTDCIFSEPTTRNTTHWMPLPKPPKGE